MQMHSVFIEHVERLRRLVVTMGLNAEEGQDILHDVYEVRKTIFEMDKMLDVLNIEIAGIQSKLATIEKYSDQRDVVAYETLKFAVREMAMRQEIELVGAESRRQAIMTVKRREEALYGQYESWRDLKSEIVTLKTNVKREERKLRDLDHDIDFLGPGELTFIIDGRGTGVNTVTIQPIRVKEQRQLPIPIPIPRK